MPEIQTKRKEKYRNENKEIVLNTEEEEDEEKKLKVEKNQRNFPGKQRNFPGKQRNKLCALKKEATWAEKESKNSKKVQALLDTDTKEFIKEETGNFTTVNSFQQLAKEVEDVLIIDKNICENKSDKKIQSLFKT